MRKTNPDGSTTDSNRPSITLQSDFRKAGTSWNNYKNAVETGTVVTQDIFQLDFNKFLRVSGTFQDVVQDITPVAPDTGRELLN